MLSSFSRLPKARLDNLVTTQAGNELLVFDQVTSQLHHLNPIASLVWGLADGSRSVDSLSEAASTAWVPLSPSDIIETLHLLAENGLLENSQGWLRKDPTRNSRRNLLKGTTAGVIFSITAPMAAQAGTIELVVCVQMGIDPPVNGGCRNAPCCNDRFGNPYSCSPSGICMP